MKRSQRRSNGNGRIQKIPTQVKTIRKRHKLFGPINSTDGLEKQILSGKIRLKCTDSLNNFVTRKESPNIELIGRTDDREDWKAMIADMSATDLAHSDDD